MKRKDLSSCPICDHLAIENQEDFLNNLKCTFKTYPKNELIIRQGDLCDALHLLTVGSVKTEMITESGGVMAIETIIAPRPLAPAFLFSDNNHFPVDVTTLEEVEIMRIPKEEIMRVMMTDPDFMKKFLTLNSNRTQFLTNRLQLLSIKTIKGKLAFYILEQTKDSDNSFTMTKNQTELADFFGVARPSLARSLSELIDEGIITLNKKQCVILDAKQLRNQLG
jgi:CRP/FNR family transcriptional regulator, dissimilatory nitrate respiration regulator